MIKSKTTLIVIGAAILVVAGALAAGPLLNTAFSGKEEDHSTMNMTKENSDGSLVQKGSDDYKMYAALKGDDYDKAFIEGMIVHHQGAVDVAELALTNAKRQEIKTMARDIISAQEKEIKDMQDWQTEWGYTSVTDHSAMDHSNSSGASASASMNMNDHMEMMVEELRGNTGDAFDKAFLEQMIMHHQGALNMAAPGEANAKHQEVKDLTKAVVEAQTKEIKQMKEWQESWRL